MTSAAAYIEAMTRMSEAMMSPEMRARSEYVRGAIEVKEFEARITEILMPDPTAVALSAGLISLNEARTL